jgi:bifunctional UDP-N-acetylglucosamine pyrophosphorylase/glucosamine-1-phosphate N-acetyltransferase
MNIVILAAGQGKRMRSALPKVLHAVAGRPLLAHVLDAAQALAHGLEVPARITVVVGHGAEAVRGFLAGRAEVRTVLQEPQLGTGHALMQAAPHLIEAEPTLVLYGDVPLITSKTLRALIEAAGRDGAGLLTVRLDDPTGYGRIVRDRQGRVLRSVEQKDATAEELAIAEVNTGILVAPTPRLKGWLGKLSNRNAQGEYYLTDCIAQAVAEGVAVAGVPCTCADEVLGVNSKEQLAQAERVVQRRIAQRLLEQGATLADPERIDVRGELTVGADVAIDVGCVFEGRVQLADGVRVGPYSVLRNVSVGAGTELVAFTFLEDSTIGAGARLGPFSRLRPGVQLGDEVHIGNFVEIKASTIGRGSKANHLAYVGDTTMGAGCNIGAGTIVANYDGANKHKTELGDDVHTGSNSVLVAPIKVGSGATVGAGSTVTREVPAGKLTVARARQVTLEHWRRPTKKK